MLRGLWWLILFFGGGFAALFGSKYMFTVNRFTSAAHHHLLVVGGIALITAVVFIVCREIYHRSENELPVLLQGNVFLHVITVSVSAYIVCVFSYAGQKTRLYIDNGGKDMTFQVANIGNYTLKAGEHVVVEVPKGLTIVRSGQSAKELNLEGNGSWVYNVDSAHTYVESDCHYNLEGVEFPREVSSDNNRQIIKKEFFVTHADFVLEVPHTITVGENDFNKTVKKRMLIHEEKPDPVLPL
ncbi:hypothetical protein [Chitinophaga sp.]|uniref:hypothetical protein n=1 Tax=Chitinophaga sp. TaxID=1869181 RepID=UPI002F92AD86